MTQPDLSRASGVAQSTISELETGESKGPHSTSLFALSRALNVRSEWLSNDDLPMERLDEPLPPEAVKVARDWLRLVPEVRTKVADMIEEMAKGGVPDPDTTDPRITALRPKDKTRR